jgi:hypothetical protein
VFATGTGKQRERGSPPFTVGGKFDRAAEAFHSRWCSICLAEFVAVHPQRMGQKGRIVKALGDDQRFAGPSSCGG